MQITSLNRQQLEELAKNLGYVPESCDTDADLISVILLKSKSNENLGWQSILRQQVQGNNEE